MKILFLTNIPVPYRVKFFSNLAERMDLTVLFERVSAKNRKSDWLNSKSGKAKFVFLKGINIGDDSAFCPGALFYLFRKYDIRVVGGYSTPTGILMILVMKILRIRYGINIDGGFINPESRLKYLFKTMLISNADFYLCSGKSSMYYVTHYGANPQRVFLYTLSSVSQNDLLTKLVDKSAYRRKIGANHRYIALSIGQFVPRKGIDILIDAAKNMSEDICFYIVGGKPTKEYIDQSAENLNRNIFFIDFQKGDALRDYYLAADMFVFPTREDIWGLVVLEALIYGLPVVTTDRCNAGLELISNGYNGYIVGTNDVEGTKKSIDLIIQSISKSDTMRTNAIKSSQSFTIENMVDQHYQFFTELNTRRNDKNEEN